MESDKELVDRDAVGFTAARKIITLLCDEGYKYKGASNDTLYYDYSVLHFTKPIQFTDNLGNWVNDHHITVKIELSNDFMRAEAAAAAATDRNPLDPVILNQLTGDK